MFEHLWMNIYLKSPFYQTTLSLCLQNALNASVWGFMLGAINVLNIFNTLLAYLTPDFSFNTMLKSFGKNNMHVGNRLQW